MEKGICKMRRTRRESQESERGKRLVTGSSLLSNDVGERLHLVLGTSESSDSSLDELSCTLVLLR